MAKKITNADITLEKRPVLSPKYTILLYYIWLKPVENAMYQIIRYEIIVFT
jgi:hypothetical protein